MDSATDPCTFVIFGATGDLAQRKLLPALYQLYEQGYTERGCLIVGTTRDASMDSAAFQQLAIEAVSGGHEDGGRVAQWAREWLRFQPIPNGAVEEFRSFGECLGKLEAERGMPANRIFYLALPPVAFPATITALGESGLAHSNGWTRIVIEKPFGRDLETARALNALVHRFFDESQVYRIDHYLGKETVQNMLVFRFANAMFETLWNRDHIEAVQISVAEELGVEERAGYYETAGALRDMVQSHLTQLLALVAMEVPTAMSADAIRTEKVKVLRSISSVDRSKVVFGQYTAGEIDGKDVKGYREEHGVKPSSRTETFVALQLGIDNWRWQGVPFYLRTGKRLARRLTEIEIKFRRAPVWMFRNVGQEELHRNALVLTMQPDESFSLYFEVKSPGEPFRLQRLPLHFSYAEAFNALPEAYQTLLLDVMCGDQTLFVHANEVEAAWSLYQPLLEDNKAIRPYPAGSWGPLEADDLSVRR